MRRQEPFAARPGAGQLREALEALGLGQWLAVLAQWLPHFDGWRSVYLQDEAIVEDPAPTGQVCALLARYVRKGEKPDDIRFATDLAHLDFLTWRARHDRPGARWVCLEEAFTAFARRGEVSVWQFDSEFPSPRVVKYWLLGELYVVLRGRSALGEA